MSVMSPHDCRIHVPIPIRSQLRADVARGLCQTQKALPPRYFYDARGSQLFEQICQQPEYYLTRTERAILQRHAADILDIVEECSVVELGSGSAVKTRLLFDESVRRGYHLHYVPIDISESMLRKTAQRLQAEYAQMRIEGLVADYLHGLAALPAASRRLVLFLGSNLGNFTPAEQERFFTQLVAVLQRGDCLVLGLDLRKPVEILEAAYNDRAGVTAAFNLNLLRRLNRELRANFDLTTFSHLAFYNRQLHQIEMHLRSEIAQEVAIADLGMRVPFRTGETIHTEISRKFDAEEVRTQLHAYGLQECAAWTDERAWFLVALFRYAGWKESHER
ncbi:MAG: L-histidine N(alpha)-methyltransferase [Candidatus Binatia bacterium]|nr:L-histidine N(alpha)-methyltransferase [Candidatus Binatia bacterium]